MQGTINGAFINRTIVDGAGWESFRSVTLVAVQANASVAASGVIALGGGATLDDGADWLLGMTFTSVDAQAPNSLANHTVLASVGALVGGQSSTVTDAQGMSMDSAAAVAVALLGTQAAHALQADGRLNDLAAALNFGQAAHTLSALGLVQLAADAATARADDAPVMHGVIAVASMAQLTKDDDFLASLVRSLLAHRQGSGVVRHGSGNRLTNHDQSSRLTVH